VVTILELTGASGANGVFRVGDRVGVRFTLTKEDGSPWRLDELAGGEALLSGPTFNYQRVLPARDVLASTRRNADGSWTHVFAEPLPAVFAPPYNDSPSFDADDGEHAGEALLDGTYTVGLWFAWDYTVLGTPYRQVGETTRDFLLGDAAGGLAPRTVSSRDNCNVCHVDLRAHGGRHRDYTMCLLCHTAGAEDANDPAVLGGTPGVTVDARVFFHALHNGRYLPSVLGVATKLDGSRDYAAGPRPYRLVSGDGTVHDYSETGWPVMPNRVLPMPEDLGYTALSPAEKELEDRMRGGVVACSVCHGDPDGDGPLGAPPDGDTIYFQQTRKACGSCHDDVDWDRPYVAQNQEMPPQPDDSLCFFCHDSRFGGALAATDGHRHPLADPSFFGGLELEVLEAREAGAHDADGTVDPGEKIRLTFTVRDAAGQDVDASTLDSIRVLVSGPTRNLQTLLVTELVPALLTGPQPYVGNLPWRRSLEYLGDATAAAGDVFTSALRPHLAGTTTVRLRTGTAGGSSTLAGALLRRRNFLDVVDSAGFARGDHVVVDDGVPGLEEYFQVQLVDGDRLWLSSPYRPEDRASAEVDHAPGATVLEVDLAALVEGVDYALDPALGEVTELAELGAGRAVLVDYTTDFVLPADYPTQLEESPDLGDDTGKWTGKALEDGTYVVGLSAYRDMEAFAMGELTPYRASSPPATREFLVGDALALEPYDLISSGAVCNACHQDLTYHGGRDRGFETCILCHGTPGAEDRPRYVSANAPDTPATTVHFRTLLHRIHRGRELARPYAVIGADDSRPYPDDFAEKTYSTFVFPPKPGATANCGKCHVGNPGSLRPAPTREHGTEQGSPVRGWGLACGSCHDSLAARAHIETHTALSGLEACELCHGAGEVEDVELVHRTR